MFRYGTTQTGHSPAPEVRILVRDSRNTDPGTFVPAIVDTGAVITCLPEELSEYLRPDVYSWRRVTFAKGSQHIKSVFVDIKIAKCDFKEHEVLLVNRPYALIGRDILNEFDLTLRGPAQEWEVNAQC